MAQFEVLFQHLSRHTYKSHENHESEQRVSGLRFEPWAHQTGSGQATYCTATFSIKTNLVAILTCYFSCLIAPNSSNIAVIPSGTLPSSSSLPQE